MPQFRQAGVYGNKCQGTEQAAGRWYSRLAMALEEIAASQAAKAVLSPFAIELNRQS
jgi:hypothetical protein